MKHLILSALLFICTIANAQVTTTVQLTCVTAGEIHEMLSEYKEAPFAVGMAERGEGKSAASGLFMLFVNPATRTWTLVEETRNVKGDRFYCVLSAGSDFDVVYKSKKGL